MILSDNVIREWASTGGVYPYFTENVNPASIDLTWSGRIKLAAGWSIDRKPIWVDMSEYVTPEGFYLMPGTSYLADSLEFVKIPVNWAATLYLKSSLGRQLLEHLHAGYFDPGFRGTATWELKVLGPWPILIKPGQRLMQLVFEEMQAIPEKDYALTGRYVDQTGPTEAKNEKIA